MKSKLLSVLVIAMFLAMAGGANANSDWWDSGYKYRQQVTVENNADSVMEAGYTMDVDISGITGSLANGDDIRVVYNGVELDRILGTGTVTFATQADIAAGASDSNYYIYYGNANAGAAPVDTSNIYLLYDDFSDNDMSDWTTSGGSWTAADGYMKTTTNDVNAEISIGTYDNFELSHRFYVTRGLVTYMWDASDNGYNQYMVPVDKNTGYHFRCDVYACTTNPYGTLLNLPYTTAPANTWHTYKVTRFNNEWKVYFNDVLQDSVTDSYVTSFSKIKVAAGWYSGDGRWDDFKLRKYISPEPTTSSGPEEVPAFVDKNKGHGNDADGIDEDNPGKGCENKNANGNRKRC
jgi:hypothetical protein